MDNKILIDALSHINKTMGEGSAFLVNDESKLNIERISSGSLGLDVATGGGYPRGRIVELLGGESSGKTTLALLAIAQVQKLGLHAALIDFEQAYDKKYSRSLGVNNDDLIVSQPDSAEQGLNVIDQLLSTGQLGTIVVDSVAAMLPLREAEGEMGDSNMGVHAKLMSQAMRKFTAKVNKSGCILIFINQFRDKIGVSFGDPRVTTGGNALKFFASVRIETSRGIKNKDTDEQGNVTSNRSKFKVIKNKTFPPYREGEYDMEFGTGISRLGEIIDLGSELGIITKKGSWFYYGDTSLGQGKTGVKAILDDNVELQQELETKIKAVYGLN